MYAGQERRCRIKPQLEQHLRLSDLSVSVLLLRSLPRLPQSCIALLVWRDGRFLSCSLRVCQSLRAGSRGLPVPGVRDASWTWLETLAGFSPSVIARPTRRGGFVKALLRRIQVEMLLGSVGIAGRAVGAVLPRVSSTLSRCFLI